MGTVWHQLSKKQRHHIERGKMLKLVLCVVAALMAGSAQAEMQLREFKNFTRLIPANVLRDQRDRCFAHTLCEYRLPDETWPLSPFCGQSKCVALRIKNKEGKEVYKLAEQVNDCGPIIDLEATPECEKVSNDKDIELE